MLSFGKYRCSRGLFGSNPDGLTDSRVDFEAIIAPLYRFADETRSRVALTDCYWCDRGVIRHFIARSVVGGFFIKLLADEKMWKKWAGRAKP